MSLTTSAFLERVGIDEWYSRSKHRTMWTTSRPGMPGQMFDSLSDVLDYLEVAGHHDLGCPALDLAGFCCTCGLQDAFDHLTVEILRDAAAAARDASGGRA